MADYNEAQIQEQQRKLPKDITISGDCGDNKQINFRIVAGSHEVFNGFVECS